MLPFIVLIALFTLSYTLGHFGIPVAFGWWTSLRVALSGMFLLTASAHWGKRRPDLIAMVPRAFPRPDLLVTITGLLEILGAVGLLLPPFARYAAAGLTLLLLAVFPANVRAARARLTIAGTPVPGIFLRTLLQAAFIGATIAVCLGSGD